MLPHEWRFHQGIYDPVRDRLVVFGGHQTTCVGHHCQISTYFREVWAMNLGGTPTWTQVAVQGDPPPPLGRASVIYDPVRDRMIIFGGSALISPYGSPGRAWALTLSGTPTWSVLAEPASNVLQRDGQSAVYDALRDRMVIHETAVWGPGPASPGMVCGRS